MLHAVPARGLEDAGAFRLRSRSGSSQPCIFRGVSEERIWIVVGWVGWVSVQREAAVSFHGEAGLEDTQYDVLAFHHGEAALAGQGDGKRSRVCGHTRGSTPDDLVLYQTCRSGPLDRHPTAQAASATV